MAHLDHDAIRRDAERLGHLPPQGLTRVLHLVAQLPAALGWQLNELIYGDDADDRPDLAALLEERGVASSLYPRKRPGTLLTSS